MLRWFYNKSLNTVSEFNPATLKFRNVEKSCPRHAKKPSSAKFESRQKLLWIFPRPKFMLKKSDSMSQSPSPLTQSLLANGAAANDSTKPKNKMVDDPDELGPSAGCVQCMAEDTSFNNFQAGVSRERMFNQQPSPQFKFYISMCALIFVSIMTVLLISDLEKYNTLRSINAFAFKYSLLFLRTKLFYALVFSGLFSFIVFILLSVVKLSKVSEKK